MEDKPEKKERQRNVYNIIAIYAIAFVFVLFGFTYLEFICANPTPVKIHSTGTSEEIEQSDLAVSIVHSKDWREDGGHHGVQYDVTILNNTDFSYTNWIAQITLPKHYKVDDSWGIQYEENAGKLICYPVDYNLVIEANNVGSFGFILVTPAIEELYDVTVEATPLYRYRDFTLFWVLIFATIAILAAVIITIVVEFKVKAIKLQSLEDKIIITQALKTFSNFIDAKDAYTRGHSDRVAYYTRELARKLNLPARDTEQIYYMALLHDVGKIGIPDAILNKNGRLTKEEFEIIKTHTTNGAEILKDFTAIPGVIQGALYHHEHFDGTGYPEGLIGDQIPFFARIICVADSYDAMSSNRCYRPRLSNEDIIRELKENSGKQFDPDIVNALLDLLRTDAFYLGILDS
ncbi:MAG: HD domain-containing protein [Lachnospiraceae bacterium]|nr:HD domain-containing protein [Candidatus Colinaster equi]